MQLSYVNPTGLSGLLGFWVLGLDTTKITLAHTGESILRAYNERDKAGIFSHCEPGSA